MQNCSPLIANIPYKYHTFARTRQVTRSALSIITYSLLHDVRFRKVFCMSHSTCIQEVKDGGDLPRKENELVATIVEAFDGKDMQSSILSAWI